LFCAATIESAALAQKGCSFSDEIAPIAELATTIG
jgi:hypothetical protein